MHSRTIWLVSTMAFLGCGGVTDGSGSRGGKAVDGGRAAGGASAGGGTSKSGGGPGAGGASPSAGGASASGGTGGRGGGVSASGGSAGSGVNCALIGCGAPPRCGEPCGAPCGCCPCVEGERNGTTVCRGGCYADVTDGGAPCNPAADAHRRSYVATSLATCATIRYACPTNTVYFQNACGCGCEQSASCPEWFDCMPSPGTPPCDPAKIQTDCPYSGIAY